MIKIKKNIPLIDQHDKNGFWGGKFGGSFIPETLKKPVEDLTEEFQKLRKNNKFIKQRNYYFKNYIGTPTSLVKLNNLSKYLGGAQIWAKVVSEANGGAHKIYNATVHALICMLPANIIFLSNSMFSIKECLNDILLSYPLLSNK